MPQEILPSFVPVGAAYDGHRSSRGEHNSVACRQAGPASSRQTEGGTARQTATTHADSADREMVSDSTVCSVSARAGDVSHKVASSALGHDALECAVGGMLQSAISPVVHAVTPGGTDDFQRSITAKSVSLVIATTLQGCIVDNISRIFPALNIPVPINPVISGMALIASWCVGNLAGRALRPAVATVMGEDQTGTVATVIGQEQTGTVATVMGQEQTGRHPSGSECVICLTNMQGVVVIPCGHVPLCVDCYRKNSAGIRECPMCRAVIGDWVVLRFP